MGNSHFMANYILFIADSVFIWNQFDLNTKLRQLDHFDKCSSQSGETMQPHTLCVFCCGLMERETQPCGTDITSPPSEIIHTTDTCPGEKQLIQSSILELQGK